MTDTVAPSGGKGPEITPVLLSMLLPTGKPVAEYAKAGPPFAEKKPDKSIE